MRTSRSAHTVEEKRIEDLWAPSLIRCSSEGELTRLAMARARASGSCGGIKMPDTPSSTISGIDRQRLAITGRPAG
jgi:hypothetical protein